MEFSFKHIAWISHKIIYSARSDLYIMFIIILASKIMKKLYNQITLIAMINKICRYKYILA